METLSNENEIRSILVDIVEKGNFPDDSFEMRHIERIGSFQILSNNKVRFWIERHPHLFGKQTRDLASSAFTPIHYQYELDTESKNVVLIKQEKDEPIIDYSILAREDVDFVIDGMRLGDELRELDSEESVVKFAEKKMGEFDWLGGYEACEDLPPDFNEKLMAEIKKESLTQILRQWNLEKDLEIEDLLSNPDTELYEKCYCRLDTATKKKSRKGKTFRNAMKVAFLQIKQELSKRE
ncbi:MAG: hypothetical protein ACFFB3_11795 [Candidatus Hodarchaeota archaeon]